MEVFINIKNTERKGLAQQFFPRDDLNAEEEFWAELGGKPDQINPAIPDIKVQEGSGLELSYALYCVSNATGHLEVTEITERPLKKDHLDTNETFILEITNQIYVWIGKQANLEEKKKGMLIAKEFII